MDYSQIIRESVSQCIIIDKKIKRKIQKVRKIKNNVIIPYTLFGYKGGVEGVDAALVEGIIKVPVHTGLKNICYILVILLFCRFKFFYSI